MSFHSVSLISHDLFQLSNFSIEEHFLFLLIFEQEGWLGDCIIVRISVVGRACSTWLCSSKLWLLIVALFIVSLAVEDHLSPALVPLENIQDVSVLEVELVAVWVNECAVLQAVFFEFLLISFPNLESLEHSVVLEIKWSLWSAVLYLTKHLHSKKGWLDEAPIATNWLILGLGQADVALVLDLYEVYLCYETAYLKDMSNYWIWGDHFNELDWSRLLKIINLFFDLSYDD